MYKRILANPQSQRYIRFFSKPESVFDSLKEPQTGRSKEQNLREYLHLHFLNMPAPRKIKAIVKQAQHHVKTLKHFHSWIDDPINQEKLKSFFDAFPHSPDFSFDQFMKIVEKEKEDSKDLPATLDSGKVPARRSNSLSSAAKDIRPSKQFLSNMIYSSFYMLFSLTKDADKLVSDMKTFVEKLCAIPFVKIDPPAETPPQPSLLSSLWSRCCPRRQRVYVARDSDSTARSTSVDMPSPKHKPFPTTFPEEINHLIDSERKSYQNLWNHILEHQAIFSARRRARTLTKDNHPQLTMLEVLYIVEKSTGSLAKTTNAVTEVTTAFVGTPIRALYDLLHFLKKTLKPNDPLTAQFWKYWEDIGKDCFPKELQGYKQTCFKLGKLMYDFADTLSWFGAKGWELTTPFLPLAYLHPNLAIPSAVSGTGFLFGRIAKTVIGPTLYAAHTFFATQISQEGTDQSLENKAFLLTQEVKNIVNTKTNRPQQVYRLQRNKEHLEHQFHDLLTDLRLLGKNKELAEYYGLNTAVDIVNIINWSIVMASCGLAAEKGAEAMQEFFKNIGSNIATQLDPTAPFNSEAPTHFEVGSLANMMTQYAMFNLEAITLKKIVGMLGAKHTTINNNIILEMCQSLSSCCKTTQSDIAEPSSTDTLSHDFDATRASQEDRQKINHIRLLIAYTWEYLNHQKQLIHDEIKDNT